MKKILLSLVSIVGLSSLAVAQQPCVPGTQSVPGATSYLIPDSATNLKHGCAGLAYSETIYLKAFRDSAVVFNGVSLTARVDSFVINIDPATIGLPSYLTLSTVPATLPPNSINNFSHVTVKGDSLACIKITGTIPAGTSPGLTDLSIPFNVKVKLGTLIGQTFLSLYDTILAVPYNNYDFVIDAPGTSACAVAINELNVSNTQIAITPTPTMADTRLKITSTQAHKGQYTIYNNIGAVVMQRNITWQSGSNEYLLPTAQLSTGVYTISVTTANGKLSKKLIKQ
jgi:hypothetical protein